MSVNFKVRREQLEDDTVYYQVISAEMHETGKAAHIEADRLNALLDGAEAQADQLAKLRATVASQAYLERGDMITRHEVEKAKALSAARAEVARLREALRRYADHDEDCDQIRYTHRACTCGYREALAQEVEVIQGQTMGKTTLGPIVVLDDDGDPA